MIDDISMNVENHVTCQATPHYDEQLCVSRLLPMEKKKKGGGGRLGCIKNSFLLILKATKWPAHYTYDFLSFKRLQRAGNERTVYYKYIFGLNRNG